MAEYDLYLKPENCVFEQRTITDLGLVIGEGEILLRSSPKRSRSQIFVSQGYRVRVSHVSVNPSCRVSKWTRS